MRWKSEHGADARGQVDLTPLNARERQELTLLAEGHTAKSIAADTGYSVASVNERLRQARRKTGIGSSRELARVFAAQKNRDEEIELAPEDGKDAGKRFPIFAKGAIVMAFLLMAAAGLMLSQQQAAPPPPVQEAAVPADPLIDGIVPSGPDPRDLAERLRAETREAVWASPAEAALRVRYASLVDAGKIELLRIRCGSTVCEVAGRQLEKDIDKLNATGGELQNPEKNVVADEVDLKMQGISFGPGGFAAYWLRDEAG